MPHIVTAEPVRECLEFHYIRIKTGKQQRTFGLEQIDNLIRIQVTQIRVIVTIDSHAKVIKCRSSFHNHHL